MKRILLSAILASGLFGTSGYALTVDVFSSGYSEIGNGTGLLGGSGIDFTGATLTGSFSSPDIQFGADTGNNWHPFGLGSFGARITGSINVAGGDYFISLLSDDGSYLFIDGVLQISRPGAHGPDYTSDTITLPAGTHSIEVDFFECCGGPSALDVVLPTGVTFSTPDTGSSLALLTSGAFLLGIMNRRLRK